jgi:hypothetical protein
MSVNGTSNRSLRQSLPNAVRARTPAFDRKFSANAPSNPDRNLTPGGRGHRAPEYGTIKRRVSIATFHSCEFFDCPTRSDAEIKTRSADRIIHARVSVLLRIAMLFEGADGNSATTIHPVFFLELISVERRERQAGPDNVLAGQLDVGTSPGVFCRRARDSSSACSRTDSHRHAVRQHPVVAIREVEQKIAAGSQHIRTGPAAAGGAKT